MIKTAMAKGRNGKIILGYAITGLAILLSGYFFSAYWFDTLEKIESFRSICLGAAMVYICVVFVGAFFTRGKIYVTDKYGIQIIIYSGILWFLVSLLSIKFDRMNGRFYASWWLLIIEAALLNFAMGISKHQIINYEKFREDNFIFVTNFISIYLGYFTILMILLIGDFFTTI